MNLIGKHWGVEKYSNREAHIYIEDGIYSVQFWEDLELKEERKMDPDGIPRSLHYAESAAENWCLGYIP